ncbi:hypothetical protein EXIGLDRAFT_701112 [Exidia glandulosa HHB12029]|uniref:Uncharacterized protein n=1 Tax=Exidia glandulosa HHB12029 TaxID=1314781 RepID=A0A165D3V6_EXIGL|nr:hypothetical protein EXIGLDRAFT_701112 [Exidia glandulosa HHB12029]
MVRLHQRAENSVIVDDTDSRINWIQSPPPNQTCATVDLTHDLASVCENSWWTDDTIFHYQGSARFTFGPNTSFTFAFKGDSVGVFGPELAWTGKGIFDIDGGTPTTVDTQNKTAPHYRVPFYTTSGLDPMKTHTLNFKYESSQFSETQSSRVLVGIDYITYGIPDYSSSQSNPSPTSATSSVASTPSTQSTPTPGHRVNLAAIVGGVLGGVLGIALLALVFVLCKRRRRRAQLADRQVAEEDPDITTVRPWRNSFLPTAWLPSMSRSPSVSQTRVQKGEALIAPPPYTE